MLSFSKGTKGPGIFRFSLVVFVMVTMVGLLLVANLLPHAAAATTLVNESTCGTTIPGSWIGIESTCGLTEDYTISSGNTLEVPGGVVLDDGGYNLTVQSGGTLLIDIAGGYDATALHNSGIVTNHGDIRVYASATNEVGATIENYGGIGNGGSISNSGSILDECGSIYANAGGTVTGNAIVQLTCPTTVTVTNTQTVTVTTTSVSTSISLSTATNTVTDTTTQTTTLPPSTTTSTITQTVTSTSVSTTTAQPPSVTVDSVNQNGQPITGYYTVLHAGNGQSIEHGYTPTTFNGLTQGTNYELELDSYGACKFSHWQGTSNSGFLTFTASGAQTFVGVYECT